MPIQTISSVSVDHPEIPFDVLRFDLHVAGGRASVHLYRCRVLPGDIWQDAPNQRPVRVSNVPEIDACLPALDAAVETFMATPAPYALNILTRISPAGELAASVNVYVPSTGASRQIANVYASDDPLVASIMPQLLTAVASANQRMQLL